MIKTNIIEDNLSDEIKKISLQELDQIIEENFKRTFRKWQSGLSVQNY